MNNYADTPFEPCLHYERDFDPEKKAPMHTMSVEFGKMVEIEDESDDDGNPTMVKRVLQKKETIRKFQGKSVEELLYTMDEFFTKARDIDMDIEQMWEEWPKIQSHGPRKVWERLKEDNTYALTQHGLRDAINDYLRNWTKDPRARNTIIKNFQKKFRKPMEADIHDHYVRLDLLMDYIDQLPTTTVTPKITEEDRKDFFFESFPVKWREEFVAGSRVDFYNATVEDIKQFMIMRKKKADLEEKKR